MTGSIQSAEDIANAIRHYLTEHPHASDSAEGVMRWWLGPEHFGDAVSVVEEALEQLVAQRIMVKRNLPDGRAIYVAAPPRSLAQGQVSGT